jgi:hypothetical protein
VCTVWGWVFDGGKGWMKGWVRLGREKMGWGVSKHGLSNGTAKHTNT